MGIMRRNSLENLIKALQIFLKYGNPSYPTHCEHDILYICGYEWKDISEEDQKQLEEFGFFNSEGVGQGIISFKYGSA